MAGPPAHVDGELCGGTGSCARIYPEVFELGMDLKAHVRNASEGTLDSERLDDAAQACPWGAISLSSDEPSAS